MSQLIRPCSWRSQKVAGVGTIILREDPAALATHRIAAFDMVSMHKCARTKTHPIKRSATAQDGTLTATREGGSFPKHSGDWKFLHVEVVPTLKRLHEAGYKICIFTNQNSIKSKLDGAAAKKVAYAGGYCESMIRAAGVPIAVFMAPQQDGFRKPGTGMWCAPAHAGAPRPHNHCSSHTSQRALASACTQVFPRE